MYGPALVILSMLSLSSDAAMSDIDCGEGMVRDLDGSCVKKFVIPTNRIECPKLSIDNGQIFLMGKILCQTYECNMEIRLYIICDAASQRQRKT